MCFVLWSKYYLLAGKKFGDQAKCKQKITLDLVCMIMIISLLVTNTWTNCEITNCYLHNNFYIFR